MPLGGKDPLVPFTSVVTAAGAAGAVAGTAEDAARWAEALYGGHVLQPATLEAAVADVKRTAVYKPRIPYGLGVQVVRYGDARDLGPQRHVHRLQDLDPLAAGRAASRSRS